MGLTGKRADILIFHEVNHVKRLECGCVQLYTKWIALH